jgi:hypothetical protein
MSPPRDLQGRSLFAYIVGSPDVATSECKQLTAVKLDHSHRAPDGNVPQRADRALPGVGCAGDLHLRPFPRVPRDGSAIVVLFTTCNQFRRRSDWLQIC